MDVNQKEAVVDTAIAFAIIGAFALPGPYGIIISATIAGVDVYFKRINENRNVLTTLDIKEVIDSTLDSILIRQSADKIQHVMDEIKSHIDENGKLLIKAPHDIAAEVKNSPFDPFANFYNMLRDVVHHDQFNLALNALRHSNNRKNGIDLTVLGLPSFLMGASTYLAVYRWLVLIEGAGQVNYDLSKARLISSRILEWIDHVNRVSAQIDDTISRRIRHVSEVKDNEHENRILPNSFGSDEGMGNPLPPDVIEVSTYFEDVAGVGVEGDLQREWFEKYPEYKRDVAESMNSKAIYAILGRPSKEGKDIVTAKRAEYIELLISKSCAIHGNYNKISIDKIVSAWRNTREAIESRISKCNENAN